MSSFSEAFCDVCHYARLFAMAKIDYRYSLSHENLSLNFKTELKMGRAKAKLQCAIAIYKVEVKQHV